MESGKYKTGEHTALTWIVRHTSHFPTHTSHFHDAPLLAVDLIIRLDDDPGRIVLIERRNPPHGWALPGGFVDVGETVEAAAVREAREETCLDVCLEALLGCYSDPARDARGHTVSAVFIASAPGTPKAADDARNVRAVDPVAPGVALAFDHARILADYLHWLKTGKGKPLDDHR